MNLRTRIENAKQSACYKVKKLSTVCKENPELTVATVYIGGLFIKGIFNHCIPMIHDTMEYNRTMRRVYDPHNGHYICLRRPLTRNQMIELDRLRKKGCSVTQALDHMNILK